MREVATPIKTQLTFHLLTIFNIDNPINIQSYFLPGPIQEIG